MWGIIKPVETRGQRGSCVIFDECGFLDADMMHTYAAFVIVNKGFANNVNLLLETIAGKNRANTAASILQSPDILREAIESSKNAKGSADRENETYLSSLEAHITQLQTQLQELATVTINSDMFKGVIDTATAFLNIVTQILDKLPLLSTAIGGLAGFKLSKAGLGKQLNIKLVSI